jgi:hypothetical protein
MESTLTRFVSRVYNTHCRSVYYTGSTVYQIPRFRLNIAGTAGTSLTPDPVLNAIEDALLNIQPKPRYLIDSATGIIDRSAVSIVYS